VDRRGDPYAAEDRTAFFIRAFVFHFDIVDAAENKESIPAGWTFIFVFHSGNP